ncbi:SUKH-4 family immunity protein [Achromobacter sp. UBA2119]|uniref:SUKH-4 family immunity protein n=1 Tax=Achromobacter sp. UBA2119 TaxID=1945911 RepID=UPI00257CFEB8|nr:SUKH-4 family immunity protein [Achromobacter sp. UBA2119]
MNSFESLRAQFARFGELRPQPRDAWQGDIALSQVLADFYEQVGPWGATYHQNVGPVGITLSETNISFPPLYKLWDRQAGYRWDASNGERVAEWQDNWLVIADQNADPFILDTQTGKILYAMHGTGAWDAAVVAPDLPTFAAAVAAVGVVCLEADEDLRNDDWEIRPEHRARALQSLTIVLGDPVEAECFRDVLEF